MPAMFDSTKPLPIPDIGNTIINAQANKVPFQKMVKRGRAPWQMLQTWPLENYPDDAFDGTLDGGCSVARCCCGPAASWRRSWRN